MFVDGDVRIKKTVKSASDVMCALFNQKEVKYELRMSLDAGVSKGIK